jgi:hypothetical protein
LYSNDNKFELLTKYKSYIYFILIVDLLIAFYLWSTKTSDKNDKEDENEEDTKEEEQEMNEPIKKILENNVSEEKKNTEHNSDESDVDIPVFKKTT